MPQSARAEGVFADLTQKLRELDVAVDRQEERFQAILAISRAIGSTLELDPILHVVLEQTTSLLEAERSTLYLVDRQRGEIWSKVVQGDGLREIRQPLSKGIAGWVCTHGEPVNVADASKDPRFNPEIDKATGFRTRAMLVVPLRDGTGEVIGAIQVLNRRGEVGSRSARHAAFTAEDEATLTAIAAQAGVAIENARLYGEMVQRNQQLTAAREALASRVAELDVLFEIERLISAAAVEGPTGGMEDVLDVAVSKGMALLQCDAGSVLLVEEETGELFFKSALGEKGEEVKTFRLELGEGIAGEVARSGMPILANDATRHPAYSSRVARRTGFAVGSVLCVPLVSGGSTIGAMELLTRKNGRSFEQGDLRLATLIAGQVARAVSLGRGREERERKARLAALGQMISGILHDLRTPMTIISGYAQLMATEPDEAERRKSAEIVLKQLDHINAMARETMAFARGDREILIRKVYLHQFVEEVAEHLQRELEEQGIELRVQANYKGAARMDEIKMKRAIYNIARNAAQAMPEGGRFTFGVDKEDRHIVFRFTDTGGGIPEDVAGRLFQSFVSRGKKEGTGLGLAIVKKVVDEHGGEISFRSRPGKGTTFTLRIPE